jgi:hypothetical protein
MRCIRLVLLLLWILGNATPSLMSQDSTFRMGIRAGYGLDFPSKNYVLADVYYLVEAGHRFNYGAFLDFRVAPKTQFSIQGMLEHQFWPKSQAYSKDCTADSFPTFLATDDSVPGRDYRLVSLVVEPSLRFRLKPKGLYVRTLLAFSYTVQAKVEEYSHGCNGVVDLGWQDFPEGNLRKVSPFNFGFGIALAKEVKVNERSGFVLESGVRAMLGQVFSVVDSNADGPAFTLVPWGVFVNIGFFR